MIKHIVLVQFKENVEKEVKDYTKEMLESLKEKIDLIKHLEVGIRMDDANKEYEMGLYTEFDTKEDLDNYEKDPKHLDVVDKIIGNINKLLIFNYEI